jgi:hypothetical protein
MGVVALVALVALAGLVIFAVVQRRESKDREQQLTSYYGVKLGSSKNEVGYALGYPAEVQGPFGPDPKGGKYPVSNSLKLTKNGEVEGTPPSLPPGSALEEYDEWHYSFGPDRVTVGFDPASRTAISVTCTKWKGDSGSKCRPILGVSTGSLEADVVSALGPPETQKLTYIWKNIAYQSLGLNLMLTKGKVYSMSKTLPKRP